jgi:G3E family GTPase
VIETTGLANPVPIAGTLRSDPRLMALYRLAAVVTTLDACLGLDALAAQPEAVLQVALADQVLLTKGDIANANQIAAAKAAISRINPGVPVTRADDGDITEDGLFSLGLPASARNHPDVRVSSRDRVNPPRV